MQSKVSKIAEKSYPRNKKQAKQQKVVIKNQKANTKQSSKKKEKLQTNQTKPAQVLINLQYQRLFFSQEQLNLLKQAESESKEQRITIKLGKKDSVEKQSQNILAKIGQGIKKQGFKCSIWATKDAIAKLVSVSVCLKRKLKSLQVQFTEKNRIHFLPKEESIMIVQLTIKCA